MSATLERIYKAPFARFIKKATFVLALAIEDEIDAICETPAIGSLKVGDLGGIRVHKFKFSGQQYLVAYRALLLENKCNANGVPRPALEFIQVGTHENFYSTLKQYVKTR